MKKKLLITVITISIFGLAAAAFDTGLFSAPAVYGTSSVTNPSQGAIVFDTSSSTFYGNTVVPGTGAASWVALGGAASSPTGSYASAYFGTGSSWSSTASAFGTDPSNSGGNTLNVRQAAGISLSAAASNVCGVTFTSASGNPVYLVTVSVALNSNNANSAAQLTDGSNQIATAGLSYGIGYNGRVTLTGTYAPASLSSVTLKIQVANTSSSTTSIASDSGLDNPVEWSIVRIF